MDKKLDNIDSLENKLEQSLKLSELETRTSLIILILKEMKKPKSSYKHVWIDEVYLRKVLKQRKELIKRMKEERDKGNKTYVSYNILLINGEIYPMETKKVTIKSTILGNPADVKKSSIFT